MAEIGLRNLTKVYGQDVTAVDRIDLDVRDGEFMVLLGPSEGMRKVDDSENDRRA